MRNRPLLSPYLSLSFSLSFPPASLLVYFLNAPLSPFSLPTRIRVILFFFLTRRDLRFLRTFFRYNPRLVNNSDDRRAEGVFYPRRCYKLFRIVKNSRWTMLRPVEVLEFFNRDVFLSLLVLLFYFKSLLLSCARC